MGGSGSGRLWHLGASDTTDSYLAIDVRHWQRDGRLRPGIAFSSRWHRNGEVTDSIRVRAEVNRVVLSHHHRNGSGAREQKSYPVDLAWTPCNLGGQRPWFLCPARRCGRRVAILYGGSIFACRRCYRLTYPSQREVAGYRAIRRADTLRARLGWQPGIENGKDSKPKGMHWRTFERLVAEHDWFMTKIWDGLPAWMTPLGQRESL